ncbi:MAG: permease-like cell division protein FtsX [Bacteroidaceae bacterium]|nr:permease-like cell division protein FtsX [Bacteroidaceae bacterium]
MPRKRKKISLRWQALTSTISTTFVLILMGLVIICALTAHRLGESVRQSLTVTVMFSDDATEQNALDYKKRLEQRQWVKDVTYISRDQALKEQTEAMGTDPTEFLGENPFTPSLELHLEAAYACTDSLLWISKRIKTNELVTDVIYQKELVENLNRNLHKVTYILLGLAILLLLVTLVLINNTVRLSVYSRRFVIHTMRLVGASWGFIRRPFMIRSLWIGLTSGILADIVLLGGVRALWNYDHSVAEYITLENLGITALAVLVCGLLLTLVCTFISVSHYLGMREGEMYE